MRKGFTLVELLVVVAIVALLAAIAIPNYVASEGRAREGALRSNMHAFQVAAEDWRVRAMASRRPSRWSSATVRSTPSPGVST